MAGHLEVERLCPLGLDLDRDNYDVDPAGVRRGELVAGAEGLGFWSAIGSALVIVALVLAGWNLLASVLYASDEAGKDAA